MKLPNSHSKGLTLLELIIAVAVLLVLVAMALPVFRSAQEASRSATCIGNLKGMAAAFQLYAADNNNLFPAARYRKPRNDAEEAEAYRQNPTEKTWQVEISPYLARKVKSFLELTFFKDGQYLGQAVDRYVFCPTFLPELQKDVELRKTLQSAGYGLNIGLAKNSWDYRFNRTKIDDPANRILLGDSDDYYLKITEDMRPNEKGLYQSPAATFCGDPVRHNGHANYAFVDGHVRSLSLKEAASFSYYSDR